MTTNAPITVLWFKTKHSDGTGVPMDFAVCTDGCGGALVRAPDGDMSQHRNWHNRPAEQRRP